MRGTRVVWSAIVLISALSSGNWLAGPGYCGRATRADEAIG